MEWKTVEKKERRSPHFMKKIWPQLRREEALRYLEKEKFSESLTIRWSEMTDEEKKNHLRKAEAWLDNDKHFLKECWEKYKSSAKKV